MVTQHPNLLRVRDVALPGQLVRLSIEEYMVILKYPRGGAHVGSN
jgi:hypothetical protein